MGIHLRVLSETYLINTNITGFKSFASWCFGKISLSTGRFIKDNEDNTEVGILVPHLGMATSENSVMVGYWYLSMKRNST